jgi:LysM repeat protein
MFGSTLTRISLLVLGAVLVWSIAARPSGAHGEKQVYTVRAYDTLWSIASSHYAGDARDAIYRIQERNGLHGTLVVPGQKLVLP